MPPKRNPVGTVDTNPKKKQKSVSSDSEEDKKLKKKNSLKKTDSTASKKKKPVVTYSSDSADSESDIDPDDYKDDYVRWYWAGDSNGGPAKGGGHQDIWVEYDKLMCLRIEAALNNLKQKLKVDKERFIDLKNMLQRRRDDPNKRRMIKRQDNNNKNQKKKIKRSASKPVVSSDDEDETDTKKKKDTKDVPNALAIFRPPTYWDPQPDTSYNEIVLDPNSLEFQKIRDTFVNTIADYHKNSKSVHKITFSTFNVLKVSRIQNPVLWLRYISRKDKMKSDITFKLPVINNVKTGQPLDPDVNEYHLYHGLNSSFITGITKFGFDPRFCSLQGMFGAGLYFAENSSKSNQYVHSGACTCVGPSATTACRCTQNDEYQMLVCRVLLGDALCELQHRGNLQGQFWYGRRTEPTKPDGTIYNSVLGESKEHCPTSSLLLREYIVYESSQVYPEYIVRYKRALK